MATKTLAEATIEFAHALAQHGIELQAVALKNPIDGDRLQMEMKREMADRWVVAPGGYHGPRNEAQICGVTFRWPDAGYLSPDGKLKWPEWSY